MSSDHETPTKPATTDSRLIRYLDWTMFEARWFLYPINVGLILALMLYVVKFVIEDYLLIVHSPGLSAEEIMIAVLGLIDIAMVANLVVMIIQGSHQIFIKRLVIPDASSRPQWLDHIDSGILKVKVALSIVGITLIQLLKDFVNIEHMDWDTIVHRMIIHGVFLLSAAITAVIWRITHPNGAN